jgi:hypothetical protein
MFGTHHLRLASGITLVFFTWMTLYSALAAATAPAPSAPPASTVEAANVLDELRATALRAKTKANRGASHENEDLRLLQGEADLDAEASQAEAGFAEVEQHLERHGLPEEIKQRHRRAVADYRAQRKALQARLAEFRQAHAKKDRSRAQRALNELADFLHKAQKTRPHPPFDPKHLPFSTSDDKVRAPRDKKEELDPIIRPQKPVKVAAAALIPGMLAQAAPAPSAAPAPEDLAETEDVQITPAIRARAEALHKNPVEIYNWVRNTLEFLPTYGSIQGADLTLQTRRGNAFDTASLLIALLRASNIPARYVYGTIQVPADQVMNWVGGVTTPEAAQSLLGQGGIPNVALVSGGKIVAFKLEHAWVEAWVDYEPSRGAVNRVGDTWVPLDGSFKQYQYTQGIDLASEPPFNLQPVKDAFTRTLIGDDAEGWISGVDTAAFDAALLNANAEIHAWFDRLESEDRWWQVEQTIIAQYFPVLMGSLPYTVITNSGAYSGLPTSLRKAFRFDLYATETDRSIGSPALTYSASLPQLAGKRLTMAFAPASEADFNLIASYLPTLTDGQLLAPEQLISTLPGYLVRLNPVLLLNEKVVARSDLSVTLGQDVFTRTEISRASGGWNEALNTHTAGEMAAIGLDLQGWVPRPLTAIDQTNTAFSVLHQAAFEFFLNNDYQLSLLRSGNLAVGYRLPSFGFFGTQFTTRYSFGIPRSVELTGTQVDVDVATQSLVALNGDPDRKLDLFAQVGFYMSAMEHATAERFLTSREYPGDAVSSVKAIAFAAQAGQKVYGINASNAGVVLPRLALPFPVIADIRNAIDAGRLVIAHEKELLFGAWKGAGYIILDPATGSGAFRINGGGNGARLGTQYGSAVALAGFFSKEVNEKFNIGVRLAVPTAKEYSIEKIWNGQTSVTIQDRVLLNAARATVLEMLRTDSFNFVDTRPVKPLPKAGMKSGAAVALAAALTLISVLADKAKLELRGIAIYTQGAYSEIGRIMESTQHISDALDSGRPGLLHWIGKCEAKRDWYRKKPKCTEKDWDEYKASHGGKEPDIDCDEYPPYATLEGGESGDAALQELTGKGVSLRWVDRSANRSCGGLMLWFTRKCEVGIGEPFAVEADTTDSPTNTTRGRWEKGGTCYQPRASK